jgi:acyl-CoA-binding protein
MTKRFDNLYPQITSFINLYAAFKQAARGKRSNPSVAQMPCTWEIKPDLATAADERIALLA